MADKLAELIDRRYADTVAVPVHAASWLRAKAPKAAAAGEMDEPDVEAFAEGMREYLRDGVKEAPTRNLVSIEVFATGNHRGDPYTEADLDNMVRAHAEIGGHIKPYLKLGHSKNQALVQADGWPAAGWVTNVKRSGQKLLADIRGVPRKIAELIDLGGYKRVSSEVYWDLKVGDKTFPRVLRAVAMLGANTPVVKNLDDIRALYAAEGNDYSEPKAQTAEVRVYSVDTDRKEEDMLEIEELKAKLADTEAKVKNYAEGEAKKSAEQKAALEKAVTDAKAEVDAAVSAKTAVEKQFAEAEAGRKSAEAKITDLKKAEDMRAFDLVLAEGVKTGRVLPVQKPTLRALAFAEDHKVNSEGVRVYSEKDGEKDINVSWKSNADLVGQLITALGKQVDFTEKSTTTDEQKGDDKARAELAKQVVEHIATEAKAGRTLTYREASLELARKNGGK